MMHHLVSLHDFVSFARPGVEAGLTLLVRTTLILGIGLLTGALLHRQNPVTRSLVYRSTLVGLVLCTLLSVGLEGRIRVLWQVSLASRAVPETSARVMPSQPAPTTALTPRLIPPLPAHPVEIRQVPPAKPASRFTPEHGYVTFIATWLTGTAALALWLASCACYIGRLRRRSVPATGEAQTLLAELCQQMAIREPELRVSTVIRSPFLTGLRRPAILLPASLSSQVQAEELRAILAHELTHLRRHDCWWGTGVRVLCAVFWPQPLLWALARQLEQVSEEICDHEVVKGGCSPQSYARCLVDLAEGLLPAPAERAMGMGVVPFRSSLGRRVEQILCGRSWAPLTRQVRAAITVGATGSVVAGLFLVSSAGQQQALAAEKPIGKPNIIGRVLDPQGNPAVGIKVYAIEENPSDGTPMRHLAIGRTDSEGQFALSGLQTGKYYVTVEDPQSRWLVQALQAHVALGEQAELPAIRLSPGVLITGVVTDAQTGRPLAGVVVTGEGPHRPKGSIPNLLLKTDQNGRFQTRVLSGRNSFWVKGPVDSTRLADPSKPPQEAGRVDIQVTSRQLSPLALKVDGRLFGTATITGRVTLPDGKPAPGIRVIAQVHDDLYRLNAPQGVDGSFSWAEDISGPDGTYRLTGLISGYYNVAVEDPAQKWVGQARERVTTQIHKVTRSQDLTLSPGGYVEGQVVDQETGQPLKGIVVGCNGPHRPRSSAMIINALTDKEGRYRLHVAPGQSYVYLADIRYGEAENNTELVVNEGETKRFNFRARKQNNPILQLR